VSLRLRDGIDRVTRLQRALGAVTTAQGVAGLQQVFRSAAQREHGKFVGRCTIQRSGSELGRAFFKTWRLVKSKACRVAGESALRIESRSQQQGDSPPWYWAAFTSRGR